MTPQHIHWVDGDDVHAEEAARLIAARMPHWSVVRSTSLTQALGQITESEAIAVVWCMAPSVPDPGDLHTLQTLCARFPVLWCLEEAQEALPARAFRWGLGDYVLRAGTALAHLPALLGQLDALICRSHTSRRSMANASAGPGGTGECGAMPADLAQERTNLQVALASMSQGIFTTDPQGRVTVYNRRVLELLGLPESLMDARPTLPELTRFQSERGDFGPGYSLVDRRGLDYIAHGATTQAPDVYWRTTVSGRTLEVRTPSRGDASMVRTFTDVSEFVRVENELRDSEARFRSLSDLSSDWYWEHDAEGRFVQLAGNLSVNGIPMSTVLGNTRWDIGARNMTEIDWAAHRAVLAANQPFRDLELQRQRPDGTMHWISVSGVPVMDTNGVLRGYRGVGRDISERKRVEGQIEQLAFYDVLTGLPNRRLLLDRLHRATLAAARAHSRAALFFIDLDNFKDLNDTLGHDIGDQLLVHVAQRLKGCVREADTVARFGGDEFVVLVEGLSVDTGQGSAEAALIASHIGTVLGKPFTLVDIIHHSTPSIGIVLFGHEPCTVDELLKQADLAMYQAKASGRNTQRFFDPEMQAAVSRRSALEADLRRGLHSKELVLYYQPIVDSAGHRQGAEALVRWSHPTRGLVPPGEFIALAEQTGLIVTLGQWVLETACTQLALWSQRESMRDLAVSINVSVRQFRQADFVERVLDALRTTGARPDRLKIELTESLLMVDVEDSIARMEHLRRVGVGFSLDDFGTGYSSLSYLKRLPLDQIKIDQGFVRDLQTDPNDAAIVRTILALAESLDLAVVAEGVETPGQLEFLKCHGCTAFQGYLFGRPMPAEALERDLLPAD